jgi:hypothetical protein
MGARLFLLGSVTFVKKNEYVFKTVTKPPVKTFPQEAKPLRELFKSPQLDRIFLPRVSKFMK